MPANKPLHTEPGCHAHGLVWACFGQEFIAYLIAPFVASVLFAIAVLSVDLPGCNHLLTRMELPSGSS